MHKLVFAAVSVCLLASTTPSIAAPCRDTRGKFIKCPPKAPVKATRCKASNGKFVKCGTPEAKPI